MEITTINIWWKGAGDSQRNTILYVMIFDENIMEHTRLCGPGAQRCSSTWLSLGGNQRVVGDMGVSINGATLTWMVYTGKSYEHGWWLGVPLFQETYIWSYGYAFNSLISRDISRVRLHNIQYSLVVQPTILVMLTTRHGESRKENWRHWSLTFDIQHFLRKIWARGGSTARAFISFDIQQSM